MRRQTTVCTQSLKKTKVTYVTFTITYLFPKNEGLLFATFTKCSTVYQDFNQKQ